MCVALRRVPLVLTLVPAIIMKIRQAFFPSGFGFSDVLTEACTHRRFEGATDRPFQNPKLINI